jgi:Mg-chelatase subunit ChlD/anti-sigma factor RsiW
MNPDSPKTPREELEARLTALLLGELSADDAAAVRQAIEQDAELAKLFARLQQTVGLVREAVASPGEPASAQTAPLKLSDERRQKLLAHFKTVAPKEFVEKKRRARFTLVELAAVIAILGVLAALVAPRMSGLRKGDVYWQRGFSSAQQEDVMLAKSARQKIPPTLSFRTWGSDQTVVSGSLSSAPTGSGPGGVLSADVVGYVNVDVSKMKPRENSVATTTPASALATPFPQIVLPSVEAESTDATKGTKAALPGATLSGYADSLTTWNLGAANRNAVESRLGGSETADQFNRDSKRDSLFAFTPPADGGAGTAGDQAVRQSHVAGREISPTTGLPVDDYDLKVADLSVTNSVPAGSFASGGYGLGGFGGGGGGGGGFNKIDANGNKVPVLGDLPVAGKLFRSEKPSSATTSPGFSLMGPVEPPVIDGAVTNSFYLAYNGEPSRGKLGGDALTTSGANSSVGVTVINSGSLALDQSGRIPDGGRLGVEPEVQRVDVPAKARASVKDVKPTDVATLTIIDPAGNRVHTDDEAVRSQTASIVLPPAEKEIAQAPVERMSESYQSSALQARQLRASSQHAAGQPATTPAPAPAIKQSLETDKLAFSLAQAKVDRLGKESSVEQADVAIRKLATNAPIPQPEVQTSDNAFSTFSLNVSDVSFKLAAASLEKGQMPDAASVRSEEFINAFDYRDPEPAAGAPVAFAWERARYPFAHNRDLLRFSLKTAAAGRQAGRPLNIVLLLDNSGSMERADRVQIIREALRVLASQLQPQDKLSVITFARTARLFADGVSGDKAGEIAEQVSGLTPEGGTNLEDAMNLAYQTAARHYLANGINRVVLLTDGAANLGDVEPDSLKQKVEAQRKQGIALDCFGIGWEGFNDDLLEVLSRNGDGRYGFINSPEEAATEFAGQLAGALKVAASDMKVQVEFNPKRVTSYRQIGYAKHQLTKEQFRDNTVDAAEIAAQEAGNALYTVEVNPAGEGPLCTVRVRYKIPGTTDYREHAWDVPFSGNAVSLEQASPAMRLAASASAFSEWLAASPFAGEVTPDRLLGYLSGVPEIYGADARPKKLEWMIRQAKSLAGKQ